MSHPDIANALADNFAYNSSSAFSTSAWNKSEMQNLNFSSKNIEAYNRPFHMEELQDPIRSAHDASAGPDEIHYQVLKHLPISSLLLLLNIWFIKSIYLVNFLLVGGKQLLFLFQCLVRIPRILPIIVILRWQAASVKPWDEWSTVDISGTLNPIIYTPFHAFTFFWHPIADLFFVLVCR